MLEKVFFTMIENYRNNIIALTLIGVDTGEPDAVP